MKPKEQQQQNLIEIQKREKKQNAVHSMIDLNSFQEPSFEVNFQKWSFQACVKWFLNKAKFNLMSVIRIVWVYECMCDMLTTCSSPT